MQFKNRFVERPEEFQSVSRNDRSNDPPIACTPVATDEVALRQSIQQARHIGFTGEHPLGDLSGSQARITCCSKDAKDVVLLRREFMRLNQLSELSHQIVGGFLQLEKDGLLKRSPGFGRGSHARMIVRETFKRADEDLMCQGAVREGPKVSRYVARRCAKSRLVVLQSAFSSEYRRLRDRFERDDVALCRHVLRCLIKVSGAPEASSKCLKVSRHVARCRTDLDRQQRGSGYQNIQSCEYSTYAPNKKLVTACMMMHAPRLRV